MCSYMSYASTIILMAWSSPRLFVFDDLWFYIAYGTGGIIGFLFIIETFFVIKLSSYSGAMVYDINFLLLMNVLWCFFAFKPILDGSPLGTWGSCSGSSSKFVFRIVVYEFLPELSPELGPDLVGGLYLRLYLLRLLRTLTESSFKNWFTYRNWAEVFVAFSYLSWEGTRPLFTHGFL